MAKILGEHVPCLVPKKTAGGLRYYWQPSAALAKKGWKALPLGQDLVKAIAAAKAENDRVDEWRNGGEKPKEVKRYVQRTTIAALIEAYRASDKFKGLAASTRLTYASALNLIEEWATNAPAGARVPAHKRGDMPVAWVTRQRVRVLRDALMRPGKDGIVQHHRAHSTLRVGRTLFAWGRNNLDGMSENPFESFDLATPGPRDQIWEHEDAAAFSAAAIRNGDPVIAFAIELAEYTAQREADLLKLQASHYREVKNLDERDEAAILAEDRRAGITDGIPMGIYVRQGKTKRWVGVPVAGQIRAKIEAAIAANAKREIPSTNILVSDRSGRPFADRWQFLRAFNDAKERAISPTPEDLAAGVVPHPALALLQFRDFRRTCVVRLGELGLEDQLISAITGHMLGSIKKILEVYMPRTTKMAARGIVARIGHKSERFVEQEKKA